jgi:RimJ/RimL family protein N-acetyltransferase
MPRSFYSAVEVPVIETARLKLRGHRLDDFIPCASMWADPTITRHIGGKPFTEEESWTRLLRYVGHWALLGFGYWVIEEKAMGSFAGEIGFADYKRKLEPSLKDVPEIGWVLATQAQGHGYATEAAHAVIAWGDVHLGSSTTSCIIHPDNFPSIRVAEKCGYRELLRTTYRGQPTTVFLR